MQICCIQVYSRWGDLWVHILKKIGTPAKKQVMPSIQKITNLMVSFQNNRKPSNNLAQHWHPPVLWRHTDKANGVLGTLPPPPPVVSTTPPFYQPHHSKTPTAQTPLSCPSQDESNDIIPPNLLSIITRNAAFLGAFHEHRPAVDSASLEKSHQGARALGVPKPRTLQTKARGGAGRKRRGVRVGKSGSGNLAKNPAVRAWGDLPRS